MIAFDRFRENLNMKAMPAGSGALADMDDDELKDGSKSAQAASSIAPPSGTTCRKPGTQRTEGLSRSGLSTQLLTQEPLAAKRKKNKAQGDVGSAKAAKVGRLTETHKNANARSRAPSVLASHRPDGKHAAVASAARQPAGHRMQLEGPERCEPALTRDGVGTAVEAALTNGRQFSASIGPAKPRAPAASNSPRLHSNSQKAPATKKKGHAHERKFAGGASASGVPTGLGAGAAHAGVAVLPTGPCASPSCSSQQSQPQSDTESEEEFDDGADAAADEAPGAWHGMFEGAKRQDNLDFKVIEDAARAWNSDDVALRLCDRLAKLNRQGKADSNNVEARLDARADDFLRALFKYWIFIKDLAQPPSAPWLPGALRPRTAAAATKGACRRHTRQHLQPSSPSLGQHSST